MRLVLILISIAIVVQAAVIGASGAYIFAKNFVVPMYRTSSLLLCSGESSSALTTAPDQNGKVVTEDDSANDVLVANNMALLLQSDPDAKSLIGNTSTVKAEVVENTSFVCISVEDKDPHTATNVANQLVQIAPQIYHKYYENGRINIVEEAKIPSQPSSPNVQKVALIGGGIGLAAGMVLALIILLPIYVRYKKRHPIAADGQIA